MYYFEPALMQVYFETVHPSIYLSIYLSTTTTIIIVIIVVVIIIITKNAKT